ncbi:hypothetical protein HDU80_003597 [Chytriomyces hyalinus]|nr:hypothetical protein HDU80_003597 [Chytriomyces hyalinus]
MLSPAPRRLAATQLSGNLPTELGRLTKLEIMDMDLSSFSGIIPTELGMLTSLTRINLHGDQMTGPIPTELGRLTNLQFIELNFNKLSGSIPTEFGLLTSLTLMRLAVAQLTGSLPTELGLLPKIEIMDLDGNGFTGTIPTELGLLTSLTQINLNANQMTGSIPSEIGRLKKLTFIDLRANHFTGSIPCELGSLKQLTTAYIYDSLIQFQIVNLTRTSSRFSGNPLVSTDFNVFELDAICKSRSATSSVASPPSSSSISSPLIPNSSADSSSPKGQQSSSAAIIGGVAGAAVILALIVAICLWSSRRKRAQKETSLEPRIESAEHVTSNNTDTVNNTVPAASLPVLEANAPEVTESSRFLVASKSSARPEDRKSTLFDPISHLSHTQKTESVQFSGIVASMQSTSNFASAHSDETGQKINGRALLMLERQDIVDGLGLEAIGERLLFEEALAELRMQSNWQSAPVDDNPPSYQ